MSAQYTTPVKKLRGPKGERELALYLQKIQDLLARLQSRDPVVRRRANQEVYRYERAPNFATAVMDDIRIWER